MPDWRRKYDPEFTEGAVRIVRETGMPIAQIARDLGVHPGTWATGLPRIVPNTKARRGFRPGCRGAEAVTRRERPLADGARCVKTISGPVGQRGDEASVARFVADQRTMHRVHHRNVHAAGALLSRCVGSLVRGWLATSCSGNRCAAAATA